MAKKLGRKVFLVVDEVTICAARTKTLTVNNEPIDVTTDCDAGITKLLDEAAQISWELSADGIQDPTVTESLLEKALDENSTVTVSMDYGDYVLSGDAKLTSYSENLPHNDATTFSVSLQGKEALTKSAS